MFNQEKGGEAQANTHNRARRAVAAGVLASVGALGLSACNASGNKDFTSMVAVDCPSDKDQIRVVTSDMHDYSHSAKVMVTCANNEGRSTKPVGMRILNGVPGGVNLSDIDRNLVRVTGIYDTIGDNEGRYSGDKDGSNSPQTTTSLDAIGPSGYFNTVAEIEITNITQVATVDAASNPAS